MKDALKIKVTHEAVVCHEEFVFKYCFQMSEKVYDIHVIFDFSYFYEGI